MALIPKPPLSDIWAGTAPAGPTGIEDPGALKTTGWLSTSACPPFSWFNWILNKCDAGVRYLLARGIPDYDALETYSIGDRVQATDGNTYKCIQANTPASAKAPASQPTYWKRWGGMVSRGIPDWEATETYAVNDIAQYIGDGKTYRCIQAGINHDPPSSPTYWERWGHTDGEIDDRATDLLPVITLVESNTGITPSVGSVAEGLSFSCGSTSIYRQVSFQLTIPTTTGSGGVVVTLTSTAAFASGVKNVQVTPSDSSILPSATAFGRATAANEVNIGIAGVGAGANAVVNVLLTGY